jgi:hypothetical protein
MMAETSAARISIRGPLHRNAQASQLRAQRTIDHLRADLHDQTAENIRVDAGGERHWLAHRRLQCIGERRRLRLRQRLRRRHLRGDLATAARQHAEERRDDHRQGKQPPLFREQADELLRQLAGAGLFEDGRHRLRLILPRDHRRADQPAQIRRAIDESVEAFQLIGDGVEFLFRFGQLEESRRVAFGEAG